MSLYHKIIISDPPIACMLFVVKVTPGNKCCNFSLVPSVLVVAMISEASNAFDLISPDMIACPMVPHPIIPSFFVDVWTTIIVKIKLLLIKVLWV